MNTELNSFALHMSSFFSGQKLEMNSCVAYKDVAASQLSVSSPHKVPQQSENVYAADAETVCDADAEALYDNI